MMLQLERRLRERGRKKLENEVAVFLEQMPTQWRSIGNVLNARDKLKKEILTAYCEEYEKREIESFLKKCDQLVSEVDDIREICQDMNQDGEEGN